jgi:hypothetical protein
MKAKMDIVKATNCPTIAIMALVMRAVLPMAKLKMAMAIGVAGISQMFCALIL